MQVMRMVLLFLSSFLCNRLVNEQILRPFRIFKKKKKTDKKHIVAQCNYQNG